MSEIIHPSSEEDLASIVAGLASRKVPVAVSGGGTRTGLGRPMQTAATVSTTKLTGVTLYEPSELVISARAGTPLGEIETLLADNGQRLAFEPIDHRPVFNSAGAPTIGAVAAANLSGPRRIQIGAARDSLIGLRAVTGRGEVVKSGGRVMKNVTGYDLVKFLAGSYGTLGVLSEVTFKVMPAPETEATLALAGLDEAKAVAALSAALGSPFSVTGAAHIPAVGGRKARTLMRIEGFDRSVAYRSERLRETLEDFGAADILPQAMSETVWRAIRDLDALDSLGGTADAPLWRISVKPGDGPVVAARVRQAFDCRALFDWGGGLVWIAGGPEPDCGAAVVRGAVSAVGGHATLVRAPANVRNVVEVFQPLPEPVMTLTRKLKEAFDPAGVLNPGRIYAGV